MTSSAVNAENVTFSTTIDDTIGCGVTFHSTNGGIRLYDSQDWESVYGDITTGLNDTNVRLYIHSTDTNSATIDLTKGHFAISAGDMWTDVSMTTSHEVGNMKNGDGFSIEQSLTNLVQIWV